MSAPLVFFSGAPVAQAAQNDAARDRVGCATERLWGYTPRRGVTQWRSGANRPVVSVAHFTGANVSGAGSKARGDQCP